MSHWGETEIGVIYFCGLLSAIFIVMLIFFFIRPIHNPAQKFSEGSGFAWIRTFFTTLIIVAMLGAMSVSFRDCHGNYDQLLTSRKETMMKGIQQVSSSMEYIEWTLIFWVIIFLTMYIIGKRRRKLNI